MKCHHAILTLGLLIFLIFIVGCTSTTQNPSSDSNSKVKSFSDKDNSFSAQLTNITVRTRAPEIYDITVFVQVQNTGNKALHLVAYSGITDWAGVKYTGGTYSFGGTLYPGESVSSNDMTTLTLTSRKSYTELMKGATFSLHFLDDKQNVHDASWAINLNEIPIAVTTQIVNTRASNLVNPSCSGWSCT